MSDSQEEASPIATPPAAEDFAATPASTPSPVDLDPKKTVIMDHPAGILEADEGSLIS